MAFENKYLALPKLSIILLDWSCRESFHGLDYFNKQNISRDAYEVVWIEYYQRQANQIREKLKEYEAKDNPAVIDKWIVMEMPKNIYYHKHLMYNLGLLASNGDIVCFCDSDALVNQALLKA